SEPINRRPASRQAQQTLPGGGFPPAVSIVSTTDSLGSLCPWLRSRSMLRGIREKGRPTMNLRTLFSALFLCASLSTQAATELRPLEPRRAEDLHPAAQAVLHGEGSVTAYGNQLIVTSTREKMRELRELVEQLDAPARRLLISVSTHESGTYTVNSPDHSRAPLRIINHNTTRNAGMRQIHASEGHPAFIQTGQSIPVTTYSS